MSKFQSFAYSQHSLNADHSLNANPIMGETNNLEKEMLIDDFRAALGIPQDAIQL